MTKLATTSINNALVDMVEMHGAYKIQKLRPARLFNDLWATVDNVIPFDPTWMGLTGYFDDATDVFLGEGVIGKSTDNTGRRMLLLSAKGKTLVMFEKHAPDEFGRASDIIVNLPSGYDVTYVDGFRKRRKNLWNVALHASVLYSTRLSTAAIITLFAMVLTISEH